jgi:uncharacterized protein YceK
MHNSASYADGLARRHSALLLSGCGVVKYTGAPIPVTAGTTGATTTNDSNDTKGGVR